MRNRTGYFYTHIADYYKLGTPRAVTIDAGRSDAIKLTVNDIALCSRSFNGKYFENGTLRVSGEDAAGQAITRWKVAVKKGGQTTATDHTGAVLAYTIPAGVESVAITSVPGESGINDVVADTPALDSLQPVEAIDMQGRSHGSFAARTALAPGIYVLRQGAAAFKCVIR